MRADAALYGIGALLTIVFAYQASAHGPGESLGILLAVGFFAATTYAFLVHPPLAVALTIPVFALLPAAKVGHDGAIGEEAGTLEEVNEPYLIMEGYIKRTPQGRVATPNAYRKLGLKPPAGAQAELL